MDYKNGKIYRVVCSETNRQYIGSTASTLVKRLHQHKLKNNKCMCKDFIEPKIFLIEDYPCQRKEQLLMRERYFMESMECVNMRRPIITKEEELERIKQYKKELYQKNKEQINQKSKEYRENNKESILKYNKECYEKNKELINQKHKEYYEKNKEKLKEKIECECGGKYSYGAKSKHLKTNKHQKFIRKRIILEHVINSSIV